MPRGPAEYKLPAYIHYYGIWDIDELYDLQEDPLETNNLIFSEKHQPVIQDMNKNLFATLGESGEMYITLYPDTGALMNRRNPNGSKRCGFSVPV